METKKLRIAIIGAGHWGPNLIRNFHVHPKTQVTWVSDIDRPRLDLIRNNYERIQVTPDWQEVVERKDVDACIISTPTASHYPIARRAIEAGKHVFVEKPLTTSYEEAMDLVRRAEKARVKLMVGHVFLFNPAVRRIREVLEKGELGELFYLYAIRTNFGPIRHDVNAMWDLAAHDFSIFLYLLGAMPESVRGYGSSFINPPIEDVVFGALHFPGGVFANFHTSWLDPKKVRQLVLVGSKKMLVFDDMAPQESLKILDRSVGTTVTNSLINDTQHKFRKSIIEGKVTVADIPPAEPLKNECHAFIDWILRDIPNPSTGKFGAEVVYLLERAEKSLKEGGAPVSTEMHDLPAAKAA